MKIIAKQSILMKFRVITLNNPKKWRKRDGKGMKKFMKNDQRGKEEFLLSRLFFLFPVFIFLTFKFFHYCLIFLFFKVSAMIFYSGILQSFYFCSSMCSLYISLCLDSLFYLVFLPFYLFF